MNRRVVFQVIGFIDLSISDGPFGPAVSVAVLGAGLTHAAVLLLRLQPHLKALGTLFAIEYILYQAGHIGGHGRIAIGQSGYGHPVVCGNAGHVIPGNAVPVPCASHPP